MNGRAFTRRRLIQLAGTSVAVGISGCLASDDGESGAEGYAPQSATQTNETMSAMGNESSSTTPVNEDSFKTRPTRGVSVPLVPTDVAYRWYRNREARFVDARNGGYEESHISGAVRSPAPNGQANSDPVENWPKSDRIVTYCRCPHHMSSLRAANLINQGYERVYALDKGFDDWIAKGHPIAGSNVDKQPNRQTITGTTAPKFAGETAWAFHRQSEQQEATGIKKNGQYVLNLPFYDVTADSMIEIKTPGYTIEESLGKLTSTTITPSGTLSQNDQ
ncbi:rhodanese-like domain-containing protein [Halocatena pleomorpha]|uniref:Rhodanese-like domain-containing protein n=1 Tax=Halocatena pleomorpha TaxID=1785090 RepID=A0A3P3R863_9EURY|nr:rhodanese-like domain-containing protein [Halocatena pleomorpha]RRJ29119.1 rhodanese-like domain-containing protein [Halocatena pleomorpha]